MKGRIVTILFLVFTTVARGETLECPGSLEVQQTAKEIPGWSPRNPNTASPFYFVEFSDGDPKHSALLLPDGETMVGRNTVLTYSFAPVQEPWVICSYRGTSMMLAKRLPGSVKHCKVTLDQRPHFQQVLKVECR